VAGKTQTYFPWSSWQTPIGDQDIFEWFHEIFKPDGTFYRAQEALVFKAFLDPSASTSGGRNGPSKRRWINFFLPNRTDKSRANPGRSFLRAA
jgi:hypothetical protein